MTFKTESDPNRSKYDLDFSEIHEIVYPADIREDHRVIARVRRRDQDPQKFTVLKLWKMSPLGVELVCPPEFDGLTKGDQIDLEIIVAGQRMYFEGLVVDLIQHNDLIRLMGVRLSRRVERTTTEERRTSPRWICSDYYFPTCVATSPFVLHEITHFQVRDVSADGMLLICSLRNKYLLPGMRIRLTVNFPMIGDFVCMAKVVRVSFTTRSGKDMLAVGVEFVAPTEQMKRTIAQYLIQFSNVSSLEELRQFGLVPTSVLRAVNFYFIKTEEDYKAVLKLRRLAHLADDNFAASDVTDEDMGDIHDAQSRILVGSYQGEIVTTARIRFNSLDEPLEHEAFIDWPASLPRRDQIIEVSRAANHPDFRHSDLLIGLFQFIAATCRQEKPYFVIGSWPTMVDFYRKLGFRETGLSHGEKLWKMEQHILIVDALPTLLGHNVGPIYWNVAWRVVSDHMIQNGILEPSSMDKLRLAFYRSMGPLTKLLMRFRQKPRRAARSSK
jgi:hypothetical protein